MLHLLPRPIWVGNPYRNSVQTISLVIETKILLTRQLVNAINAETIEGVVFIHWIIFYLPINKSGTGEK